MITITMQTLCSYDQFSNLVLQDAVERRMVLDKSNNNITCYTDIPLGVYVVRGDSMVLSGALNPAMNQHPGMKEVSLEEFEALVEKEENKEPQEWDFDADLIA
jgi:U6 snRNA-associated Sm-like protein LSm1